MCLQLAVPVAVSTAVRIDTITCIIVFHVSFFITFTCLSPALLRAEGPSAPFAWHASAVRVTLDVSAANYYIAIAVHEYSRQFLTSHSSLFTHHFLLHHFFWSFWSFGHLSKSKTDAVKTATII